MNEPITLEGLIKDLKKEEFERGVDEGESRELRRIRECLIKCNQYPNCFQLEPTQFNLVLETHNFVDFTCSECGLSECPF